MRRSDKYTLLVALLALALIAVFYVAVHRPRTIPPAVTTALPATPGHYLGVAEANEIGSYTPVETFAASTSSRTSCCITANGATRLRLG
jgi:hypothetical protein